ncbi:pectinesterase family protein [Luteimicrobium xylanilyticum]|uniref:Pectinesterase n=1 Tax=Luteimicrobium xylanilyticum TaxID=1133546 RepID=A0A5P9Q9X4_9MICO|nr:pectinesterase family protein [Luteimicrobium xylanilyticum]QFU98253.1 Pectinesterase [Luteimicrobium xylanilyticum]
MSQQSRPLPPTDVVADVVVAADGSGDARTVQEGVDLAPAGADRVVVRVEPGVYRGPVVVGPDKTGLALVGATGDPDDVVIVDDRANGTPRPGGGTWGTAGSATVTVAGDGFEARHVTFANAFDDAAHPEIVNRQAVALRTLADRVVLDHVRLLGHQDTLFLDSPAEDVRVRVYVHDSHVQGDVDFVFGRATAVLDGCTIMALRHTGTPNGYLFAPSTATGNPHGFLVTRCSLVSDADPGSYALGRPWHPSSAPGNDPRVVVRDSTLGRHLAVAAPWEPMHGYDWLPGRNAEHHNDGPGALVTLQRPQLAEADARAHVPAAYLAGDDGWAPQRAADLSAG